VKRCCRSEGRLPARPSSSVSSGACSVSGSTSGAPVSASVSVPGSWIVLCLQAEQHIQGFSCAASGRT
jgi:hypothetical protein